MMARIACWTLTSALALGALTGCKKGEDRATLNPPPPTAAASPAAPGAPPAPPTITLPNGQRIVQPAPLPPPPPKGTPGYEKSYMDRAKTAVAELRKALVTRLQEEMKKSPGAAIEVCAKEASAITARVAREQRVRLGRSSLKLRNRMNTPLPWVKAWLQANAGKKAKDAQGVERIDQEGADKVARFLHPIGVETFCLTCHGPEDKLPPEVKTVLEKRYDKDEAVGYAAGDLRGAVWAEADIPH